MDIATPHRHYERLIARAHELKPVATAVAHPCDETSLRGAIEAAQEGLIRPILVGPAARIAAAAKKAQLDLTGVETVDAPHSVASAAKAVALGRAGKAALLM
jgi:phosphate acetyltransferase